MHAFNFCGCKSCRGQRNVYLSGFCRYKSGVLFLNQKYSSFNFRLVPVIILICFQNKLLSLVPLYHFVRTGTDNLVCGHSEFVAVSLFRYNTHLRYRINKGYTGFCQLKFYGSVVFCRTAFHHG